MADTVILKQQVKKDQYLIFQTTDDKKVGDRFVAVKPGEGDADRPDNLLAEYSSSRCNNPELLDRVSSPTLGSKRLNDKAVRKAMIETGRWELVKASVAKAINGTKDGKTEFLQPKFTWKTEDEVKEQALKDWYDAISNTKPTVDIKYKEIKADAAELEASKSRPFLCNRATKRIVMRAIKKVIGKNKKTVSLKLQGARVGLYVVDILDANDQEFTMEILYNDYDSKQDLDELAEYDNIKLVKINNDMEMTNNYMKETNNFDAIIGNPPYERTLHAEILNTVLSNNKKAEIVWLAPEGLVTTARYVDKPTGDANTIVALRIATEARLSSYTHWGRNFGDYKLPVDIGIYTYSSEESSTDYTYAKAATELVADPTLASILEKLDNAVKIKCSTEGMNFGYEKVVDADGKVKDKIIGKNDSRLPAKINEMMQKFGLPDDKKFYVYTVSCLHYVSKGIAQKTMTADNYNGQTSVLTFDDAEYADKIFNNINEKRYAYILKLFGDKRNVYYRANNWPESYEACGFNADEDTWLERNFNGD